MPRQSPLRAAVVQLRSTDDLLLNLETALAQVARAAELGARLVLLPEGFAHIGAEGSAAALAETLGDPRAPIQSALATAATTHRICLVAGGMPERSADPQRPYNTCVVFSEEGQVVATYRKIHLFDVDLPDGMRMQESAGTSPGEETCVAELLGSRIGLSICYDLRFPELYRRLVDRGAEILLVPSAFTHATGQAHWHVLLRARAIESQAWVLAANQWGAHSALRRSFGHSLIIDPWGDIRAECRDEVGIAVADLDRAEVASVRGRFPVLAHRRLPA